MKKTAFLLALGIIVFMVDLQASVKISFRLSGTYGYLMERAGDIDEARRGMESQLFNMNQQDRLTTTFNWKKPSRMNDFRAELLFRITRNFGISIGSGYILAKNQGSYSVDAYTSMSYDWYGQSLYEITTNTDYSRKYTLSAIPITLDAYFIMPLGKKETFKAFAHAGVGYYFGRLQHNLDMYLTFSSTDTANNMLIYESEETINAQFTEKTNSNSWGYHGGLGLDIKLTRLLSIGAEVYGRHVVFRDWEGSQVAKVEYKNKSWSIWYGERTSEESDTDSAYGNLWTYQAGSSDGNNSYTMMWVWDEEPEGYSFQNVRKSSINLNSYGISISLKLSFSLF